jgi:hypothetical protein
MRRLFRAGLVGALAQILAVVAATVAVFNGPETSDGELILRHAGKAWFRGPSLQDGRRALCAGNRGLWREAKSFNRQEFVIVGWSDPEGTRPHLAALLGYTPMMASSSMPAAQARV